MSKRSWFPVEECDEVGVAIRVHIMHVVMCDEFKTEKEALDFVASIPEEGDHCLTDEEGYLVATFFGHDASPACACGPEFQRESIIPTYIHRMTQ